MAADLFATENGLAVIAVTVAEMREIDRVAVEELGPALMQMMENAGRNLAEEVMAWTAGQPGLVAVLAGSGGNGGGGNLRGATPGQSRGCYGRLPVSTGGWAQSGGEGSIGNLPGDRRAGD